MKKKTAETQSKEDENTTFSPIYNHSASDKTKEMIDLKLNRLKSKGVSHTKIF